MPQSPAVARPLQAIACSANHTSLLFRTTVSENCIPDLDGPSQILSLTACADW